MRLTLLVSLLFAAAPACAEWVKVGTTMSAVHYVDTATVRKDGNLRRVWALQDMQDGSLDGVLSIRALQEHDCSDGRFRYLSISAYPAQMGAGQAMEVHELRDDWSGGGNRSAVGKIVCSK